MGKNKLNIAQLHWGFPPIIGGVETHLSLMLPVMAQRGHKVGLLTGSVEGVKTRYKYKDVSIYRTPLMDLNWLYKRGLAGLEDEVVKTFKEFFKQTRPDLIHAHNMHYFSKLHAEILQDFSQKKGLPLILTAHNVWDELLFLELVRQINWTQIIAVSHFIKKELIGAGSNERKISVVHHGVDTKVFKPGIKTESLKKKYPQLKNKRIIFHPARMGLAKGCDVSVKALNIVKKRFPDTLLVMAGTKNIIDWGNTQQKDIAYIVNLIKIFNLENNVLIDMFSLDEIAQIYGLSCVCLYPSTSSEPFGITMLEALASGKPMIVTKAGGMPEIIRDGINGYVVPIRDFEALASRIIQLLANEELNYRLGNTGREMVLAYHTKEMVAKNTLSVYRKVLGK